MQNTPRWQPLDVLPEFCHSIDELYSSAGEQLKLMTKVLMKPSDIDAKTLNKVIDTYSEHLNDHWILVKQFEIWRTQTKNKAQLELIDDCIKKLGSIKESNQKIIAIAKNLSVEPEKSKSKSDELDSTI